MKRAYTFDAQTDQPSQKKQFPFELSAVFPREMNCFSRFFSRPVLNASLGQGKRIFLRSCRPVGQA